jgi:hypothetical protein
VAQSDIYAVIMTKGGIIKKTYKDADEARADLQDMIENGEASRGCVFENFLFEAKANNTVVFDEEFVC